MQTTSTIKVKHVVNETIVESNGLELKLGENVLNETAIVSVIFQALYVQFKKMEMFRDEFEIALSVRFE